MSDKSISPVTNADKFLKKTFYVIFTRPVAPWDDIAKVIPEHLAYQVDLERRGIMFGAGPLSAESPEPRGRGMVIIRASSFEEARAIADADPMHRTGVRSYTIDRWTMNEGTVTVRITYSDQRMVLE